MSVSRKIINDPVLGFITIPDELTFRIIEHPWFQRLRRISQLGLTNMVYPGALHTRFHHALGAFHLMQEAIETLRGKGIQISPDEAMGSKLAILLHDIGHGPFSHALEHCIVKDLTHEEISLLFISRLNQQFDHQLDKAIEIFSDSYPVRFLHQLVSGQLDMDRMDYLMRDSFFTGVSEGVINTERILKMITVAGDELAVELKGIYSIEKFIVARRLMYWEVYYHKTVLAAEYMLVKVLERARFLADKGEELFINGPFGYFLKRPVSRTEFLNNPEVLEFFARLDDYDVLNAVKTWVHHPDSILSYLSTSLIDRKLFRVIISDAPSTEESLLSIRNEISGRLKIPFAETDFLMATGTISNSPYDPKSDKINIVDKEGVIKDISEISDQLNIGLYTHTMKKHFVCFPKWATSKG